VNAKREAQVFPACVNCHSFQVGAARNAKRLLIKGALTLDIYFTSDPQ